MEIVDQNLIAQLQEHARFHQLDEVAAQGILKWIADPDLDPLPVGITKGMITGRFVSRWLCFEPQHLSYPYIDTRFDLLCGDTVVGYYRLISRLNGDIEDDYFVINQ
ncbi:MAG: hypothetical protein K1Y36_28325 [Blastocatellia bacterium]|nr:hypothetical protein [Blastocatellia bacterium]